MSFRIDKFILFFMPVFLTSWFPPCAPGTCAAVPITWPEFAKKPSRPFFIPVILLQFVRIFCDRHNQLNKEAQTTTTTASKGMSKEAKQAALACARQWADDQRNWFNKEAQATTKSIPTNGWRMTMTMTMTIPIHFIRSFKDWTKRELN
jgi:hypothetical protein